MATKLQRVYFLVASVLALALGALLQPTLSGLREHYPWLLDHDPNNITDCIFCWAWPYAGALIVFGFCISAAAGNKNATALGIYVGQVAWFLIPLPQGNLWPLFLIIIAVVSPLALAGAWIGEKLWRHSQLSSRAIGMFALALLLFGLLFIVRLPTTTLESSQVLTIDKPRIGDYRLDWCREWAQNCGKPAADEFCRRRGFVEAKSFKKAPGVGQDDPTRVIGAEHACREQSCDGFASITCHK